MSEPLPEPYLLHRNFGDFDEFDLAIRAWNTEFRQLDAGPFNGQLLQMGLPGFVLSQARFGRVLDQRGEPPKGMRTLVVPASAGQRFTWRGHEVTGSDLLVFPAGGELEAASRPGFGVFTISLSEDVIAETMAALELPDSTIGRHEVIACRPQAVASLARHLQDLCDAVARTPDALKQPGLQEELTHTLPRALISTLASNGASVPTTRTPPRQRVHRSAQAFIAEYLDAPLTVGDLCRALGVSERTLRRAFLDRFGVAPKAYLQALRLNGVHRDLRRADPSTTKVSDVANAWGFWHLGQFAADYRRMFGKLPSATLGT